MTAGIARHHLAEPGCFVASEGLRITEFDDEAVVFDPLSWEAHLLNAAATAVLDLFLSGPQTEQQVQDYLSEVLLPQEQAEAAAHAKHLIRELVSLGLIRPAAGTHGAHR